MTDFWDGDRRLFVISMSQILMDLDLAAFVGKKVHKAQILLDKKRLQASKRQVRSANDETAVDGGGGRWRETASDWDGAGVIRREPVPTNDPAAVENRFQLAIEERDARLIDNLYHFTNVFVPVCLGICCNF